LEDRVKRLEEQQGRRGGQRREWQGRRGER
jgi:hypothetical protein